MSGNEITPEQARKLLPKARAALKRAEARIEAGTISDKQFGQLLEWEETLSIIGSRNRGVIEHMAHMSKRNPGHGTSWHQHREIRLAKHAKRLGRGRARRPFRGISKPAALRLVEKYLGRMNPVLTNPKRKLTQAQKLARAKNRVGRLFAGGRHLGTGSSSKRWRRYLKWNKAAAKAGEWQSSMGHASARQQRESARGMQYLDIDLGLKRAHAGQWNSKGRKPVRMSNPWSAKKANLRTAHERRIREVARRGGPGVLWPTPHTMPYEDAVRITEEERKRLRR